MKVSSRGLEDLGFVRLTPRARSHSRPTGSRRWRCLHNPCEAQSASAHVKKTQAHERNKSARSKVSPVVTPGEQAFSRPKGASTPPALADFALKPFAVKPASTPRLQARAATKYAVEEDDDTSSDGFAANGGKKESLADFFNSVPPWEKDEGAIVPSTEDRNEVDAKIAANRARRLAKQKAEAAAALSVSAAAPVTPMDPDVMPAPSMSRARSQPNLLGANTPARRKLQAKDERETRPSARDVIDFLSAGPAPVARPITRARSESVSATSQTTSTSSRRGNRLKTFMGKFGNSHADAEDEVSPPASPAGTLPRKLHSKRGGSVSSNTTISSLSPVFHPPTTAIQPARFVYQAPEARPSTGMESLGITTTMSRSSSQDVYRTPSSSMPPSRSTHGMLTPDSSMEDVARRSYITKPPESDLPTPPLSVHQSPTRVKRIPVPSHVPSEAAEMLAELAKDKTDEEASRRLSAVSAATVAASIQAKAQAKHDIGVQTAVTTPTPLEPVSVLVEALLALRERMAAAPAEQHLAILDETIASLPPADDDAASRAAYMVEMEARVVELFLSGGADLSSSATTILTPDTPGLTDQSDDEAEGETLRTPVVPLSTLAPPEVDEDEETGVLGKMDRVQLRKQQETQRRAVHSLLEG